MYQYHAYMYVYSICLFHLKVYRIVVRIYQAEAVRTK